MKFKTDIVHKVDIRKNGVYYMCNHAIGVLSTEQLLNKTNWKGRKITCKNCRKRYLFKRCYR